MVKVGFAALTLALAAACAQGQSITLKLAHFLPPVSTGQKDVLEPWCDRLDRESGGRLKCQIYPAMQLGGTPSQLVDQVRQGVADIVWTAPSYSAGRFPIIEAVELPFMMPGDVLGGSRAMWEFYEKYATKEFADYKVLAIHSGGGLFVNSSKRPMLSLASFEGAKLRTPSRLTSKLVAALGATPVAMPAGQVTEAVSKGVVDGALGPWDMLAALKLDEVAHFQVLPPPGEPAFSAVALAVLMNKARYEGLPADLRAIIDRNSGLALAEAFGSAWDRAAEAIRKRAVEHGNKVESVSPADYAAMRTAAAGVEKEWVREAAARVPNAEQTVTAARGLGAKYLVR